MLCAAGIPLILLSEVFQCVQVQRYERMCCFLERLKISLEVFRSVKVS